MQNFKANSRPPEPGVQAPTLFCSSLLEPPVGPHGIIALVKAWVGEWVLKLIKIDIHAHVMLHPA